MLTQADVRRIALALPGVEEDAAYFKFSVRRGAKETGIAWVWRERAAPRKPRVPNPDVVAVRVASVAQRDMMIAAEPAKYFTEPHYEGYPAVLVRLAAVTAGDLAPLLDDAARAAHGPARRRR